VGGAGFERNGVVNEGIVPF